MVPSKWRHVSDQGRAVDRLQVGGDAVSLWLLSSSQGRGEEAAGGGPQPEDEHRRGSAAPLVAGTTPTAPASPPVTSLTFTVSQDHAMLATAHRLMDPSTATTVAMVTTGDSLAFFTRCFSQQTDVAPPLTGGGARPRKFQGETRKR